MELIKTKFLELSYAFWGNHKKECRSLKIEIWAYLRTLLTNMTNIINWRYNNYFVFHILSRVECANNFLHNSPILPSYYAKCSIQLFIHSKTEY
jgi:hypothetical protein